MPLSRREIRTRATRFAKEWAEASDEHAEAKTFWYEFFQVFGISQRRVGSFEVHVKKLGKASGFIDFFWPGTLLIEHKSRGKDLDKALQQAVDYLHGVKDSELPRFVLVSDFARLRLRNMEERTEHEILLEELPDRTELFDFIAGYEQRPVREQDPVNIKAAELMGQLHDELRANGYEGHELKLYLVRLLFCLFADDTGIFEPNSMYDLVDLHTREDGTDLGNTIAQLFQVLNTPPEKRQKNLSEAYKGFSYVNGKLFAEHLPIAAWDSGMRVTLLECCSLDWAKVSPAIFGSMFQGVMDPKQRRDLGAHYTSEENILKLIRPLFLDELWEEYNKVKGNRRQLERFHHKLAELRFLDPACGCGNFLVITYRELRRLELEILRTLQQGQQVPGTVTAAGIRHNTRTTDCQ